MFEIGSEQHKKFVVNKEKLEAICTPCGNLAHFFKEFYDLNADEINSLMKNITKIKDKKIKKAKNGRKASSSD